MWPDRKMGEVGMSDTQVIVKVGVELIMLMLKQAHGLVRFAVTLTLIHSTELHIYFTDSFIQNIVYTWHKRKVGATLYSYNFWTSYFDNKHKLFFVWSTTYSCASTNEKTSAKSHNTFFTHPYVLMFTVYTIYKLPFVASGIKNWTPSITIS